MHSERIIGYATALYTYQPSEDTQATDCAFNKGDILVILKENAGGWLEGYIGGFATGGLNVNRQPPKALNIPGNYVRANAPFKR